MTTEPLRAHAPAHARVVREAIAKLEAERKATVDRARTLYVAICAKAKARFQAKRDLLLAGSADVEPPKPVVPPVPESPVRPSPVPGRPAHDPGEDELMISLSDLEEDRR